MKTGYRSIVTKLGDRDYTARVQFVDEGRVFWSRPTKIRRLSRGDAMKDAEILTHNIIIENLELN